MQYFLKPREFKDSNLNKVFFWQRRIEINFLSLKKIFQYYPVKIHIHVALDGGHSIVPKPNKEDEERFGITYSHWCEDKNEMETILDECGIYIAPRTSEGIGLSFLHALSLGKVIIAYNAPTMNEYIIHNVNGYLIDFENPQPIDFSNIKIVQENARKLAKEGYEKWLKDREKFIDFMEN
ncbi:hypothetical protein CQA53_03830 [Helicobacter didelphidarum]|uniref:Glycosyl transferase family 1 domain-containing protein n=1 Tax=Helicobacter didelphidarum TaxID=2040648 RepID=A0A3D8IMX9_9HELI|nr:glycosyltransferase [Helicobacter didelphidarum]RDU66360.1 hypothetical protein CQA53_03830 [Helicobacter didelphidarum]